MAAWPGQNQNINSTNKMKFNKWLLGLTAIAGLLCALPAQADIYSTSASYITNSAISSTNGPFFNDLSTNVFTTIATGYTITNVNSDPIPVGQHRGLALFFPMTSTNGAGTEQVTNWLDMGYVVAGATNWTTTHPIKQVSTLSGSNLVVDVDILDPTELDNVAFIRSSMIQVQAGHTNTVTIYPPVVSHGLTFP
jgi:hypothetical protein